MRLSGKQPFTLVAVTLSSLVFTLILALRAGDARGNGAFPDSLQILLPADRPEQLGLSTNFGLILSDDAGKTWNWVCEGDLGAPLYSAYLYQVGPSPVNRLVAVTPETIVSSLDNACTWELATGAIADGLPTDVFSDPSDPDHLLAVRLPSGILGQVPGVYESRDGGRTFDKAIFETSLTGGITSVEIARSDPKTIYVAWHTVKNVEGVTVLQPKLARSHDGGETWESVDVEPFVGSNGIRIIAVDPEKPQRLFLRVLGAPEKLAVSDDGGTTLRIPVELPGSLSGFVRMPNGVLLVGGTIAAAIGEVARGAVFRSIDGGQTFSPWLNPPRIRGLAQRDGKLYLAGDNFVDGFALAEASDDGAVITPLMRFDSVSAIRGCVQSQCAAQCRDRALLKLWPEAVCGGGTGGAGGGGGSGGTGGSTEPDGCGCRVNGAAGASILAILAGVLVVFRRLRR